MSPTKKGKKLRNFMICVLLDVLFSWAEGFSCSLSVLYRGLGINNLQFLIKKIHIFFQL
jgi:hypothetical protein